MVKNTGRLISWVRAARKDFEAFPLTAQQRGNRALSVIADGATPDIAKPLTGLGPGVWELAIKDKGDAFRVVYLLELADEIWVIHAFQKKSTKGIATPKHDINLIRDRIKRLKEQLRE
jgi:phage-related protein